MIGMDIMHVNDVPFLATISKNIYFSTIEALPDMNGPTNVDQVQRTINVYRRRNLRPRMLFLDGAFRSPALEDALAPLGVTPNTTGRDEHVGLIEQQIRTIKERMRATYNMLPFDQIPKAMIIELAKSAVFWLNAFPHPRGISDTLSLRTIITGETIDHQRHCRYTFGDYVQLQEEHDNSTNPRTIGGIALRPTGNRQGSYDFFNLSSGRVVTRNYATKLPMPEEVIKRVHTLAEAQRMMPGLAFGNRDNRIVMFDDDNPMMQDDDEDPYEPPADAMEANEDTLHYDYPVEEGEVEQLQKYNEPIQGDPPMEFHDLVQDENQGVAIEPIQGVQDVIEIHDVPQPGTNQGVNQEFPDVEQELGHETDLESEQDEELELVMDVDDGNNDMIDPTVVAEEVDETELLDNMVEQQEVDDSMVLEDDLEQATDVLQQGTDTEPEETAQVVGTDKSNPTPRLISRTLFPFKQIWDTIYCSLFQ